MKTIIDNDKIIILLHNKYIKKDGLKEYFKHILSLLNKKYNIEFNGYYNIDVYEDTKYGMVLEIKNEDLEYYNYFNQVDLNINIINSTFLYRINYEYLSKNINNITCYKYMDNMYLKMDDDFDFIHLIEYVDIVYGEKAKEILRYGEKVNI